MYTLSQEQQSDNCQEDPVQGRPLLVDVALAPQPPPPPCASATTDARQARGRSTGLQGAQGGYFGVNLWFRGFWWPSTFTPRATGAQPWGTVQKLNCHFRYRSWTVLL